MAIKLVSINCPECGATLNIEENRTQAFCTYCGTKVLINNENEHIFRHIDEAGIKQAEVDREIKLKQLELVERKRVSLEKSKKRNIAIALGLAVIGILMISLGYLAGKASGDSNSGFYMISMTGMFPLIGAGFMGLSFMDNAQDDGIDLGDKAKVPAIGGYQEKSYTAIKAMFESAGFTNIKCVGLHDLRLGLLKKPGLVESITINGHTVTSGGKKYPKDAAIVISYHSHV